MVIFGSLPSFKGFIEAALAGMRQSGRKRDMGAAICAAVVAECFRLLHGKVQPHSTAFVEACDAYWRACGHDSKGDPDNWRRIIKRALATDHQWIRLVLEKKKEKAENSAA
jgi:hypothetical protein